MRMHQMENMALCAQNEEKNKGAPCTLYSTLCFYIDNNPILKIVLRNPNYMCFSFTRNNPKQLQGNSTQCTDKEPRVVSRGRARSNPFQPQSIHYRITMITFWAVCFRHAWIHSPLHSTTLSMLHSFGKMQFSIEYSVVLFKCHFIFISPMVKRKCVTVMNIRSYNGISINTKISLL